MVELWTIEPSPTPGDPRRHTLWLKGQLADVQLIIRRFGALCGRPQKQRANADYNFSLYLRGPDPDALRNVQSWLADLGPSGPAKGAPAQEPAPAPALPPAAEEARPAPSPFAQLLPTADPEPLTPPPMPAALEPAGSPAAVEAAPSANPFADLMPRTNAESQAAITPPPVGLPPVEAEALPAMPTFSPPAQRAQTPFPALPPLEPPQAQTPPPIAGPGTPPPAQAPTPSPFGPQPQPQTPFPAQGPEGAAPPPLTEAPSWPGSQQGVALPAAAPAPSSPFDSLPPAPTMFPGLPPAPGGPAPEQAPPAPAFPMPAPVPQPAAPAPVQAAPDLKPIAADPAPGTNEPLFGALVPLQAAFTLETLQVGSFNRFSHAASMSVIANPGAMYNPLFLFGSPGVGKTHLLTAIGKELQQQSPNDPVFLTTGPRLSRAVTLAKRSGRLGEIEAFAKKAKALLIDDVHTLQINEQNQEALASLLAGFFSTTRQVVMTSVYPPRMLGALEEALKFQISAGWSVDMKPLSLDVQKEIVGPALSRNGFDVDAPTIDGIIPKLEGSFFELTRWIDRLKALLELRAMNRQSSAMQDLLPQLLMPDVPATNPMTTEEVQALIGDMPGPQGGADALPVAAFFPQGREVHGDYLVRQFCAVMKQNNWPIRIRAVLSQAYDPEQLYGVPFTLMDACAAAGARVALVLGPNPGSGLAAREPELQHAVQHLLEGLDLRVGWVSFLRIKENGPYFRAGLDVFPLYRGQGKA